MSRSYKRTPVSKPSTDKRYCNKIVRRAKDVPNGRSYKKLVYDEWWDGWEYNHFYERHTWKQFVAREWRKYNDNLNCWRQSKYPWVREEEPVKPNEKEMWKFWFKYHKMK